MVRPVVAGTMCEPETERQSTRAGVATDSRRLADQLEIADTEPKQSPELDGPRPCREVMA
jgi:hypothetical protein